MKDFIDVIKGVIIITIICFTISWLLSPHYHYIDCASIPQIQKHSYIQEYGTNKCRELTAEEREEFRKEELEEEVYSLEEENEDLKLEICKLKKLETEECKKIKVRREKEQKQRDVVLDRLHRKYETKN